MLRSLSLIMIMIMIICGYLYCYLPLLMVPSDTFSAVVELYSLGTTLWET